jgi:cobalt-zinc-cadmium efflux system membrane fusion protein
VKKLFLNKYFWIASLALIAGIIYSVAVTKKQKVGRENKSTAKVQSGEIVQRSTIAGTVTPRRKTVITAPYLGYVQKVFVKLGQNVKSGEPIASVAPTLVAGDTVFPLRAPFAGRVVQLNKAEGEFVKASDADDFIARLDDTSKMYINSNVPELDRVKMQIGLEAVVKASAILDRTYKGVVRELTFAARERDGYGRSTAVEFPMRLEILDFDEKLQPGMSVIVDIITLKKDDVLRLRHEFIGKEKDNYFVTLAGGQRQKVELGIQNEEFSEIKGDIKAGTVVQKVDFSELIEK